MCDKVPDQPASIKAMHHTAFCSNQLNCSRVVQYCQRLSARTVGRPPVPHSLYTWDPLGSLHVPSMQRILWDVHMSLWWSLNHQGTHGIPWDVYVSLWWTCYLYQYPISGYTQDPKNLCPTCPTVPWYTWDPIGRPHVLTVPCNPSVQPVLQSHGTHGIPWDVHMS